jgi:hypothetical protein
MNRGTGGPGKRLRAFQGYLCFVCSSAQREQINNQHDRYMEGFTRNTYTKKLLIKKM